jgi:phage gp29-like protein
MQLKNFFKDTITYFSRPNKLGEVIDGTVLDKVTGAPQKVDLFEEQAATQLIKHLTRFPDVDEVLRQAGVKRDKLRALLYDDEIAQACETRLDALLSTPLRFEPTETTQSQKLEQVMHPIVKELLAGAWQARLFGYSVLEAVYEKKEDGSIGFKFLGEKPFVWFEPKSDGRLVYYPDNGAGGAYGVEVDQRYKFFLTRCKPTYAQPYGEALLSRLYWPWYFRTNGWKFWAKFLERFGAPLLVGKSSDPKEMVKALLGAHSQAVMGVDRDDSVDAVGTPAGNSGQTFEIFETAIIRRIQKVILGQTLTSGTDGGSGNRALGQVHNDVRNDKRNSDIQMVLGTVQRVVDAVCELNGWGKHEAVFADEVGLEKDRAVRDKDLFALGVRFEKGYFEDRYDLNSEDFSMLTQQTSTAVNTDKIPVKASLFSSEFTAEQNRLENQIAEGLKDCGEVLNQQSIRSAIETATSPQDMAEKLFSLIGDKVSEEKFQQALEQALFAADVIGYVSAVKDD